MALADEQLWVYGKPVITDPDNDPIWVLGKPVFMGFAAAPPVGGQPTMKRWGGIPYMYPKGQGVW